MGFLQLHVLFTLMSSTSLSLYVLFASNLTSRVYARGPVQKPFPDTDIIEAVSLPGAYVVKSPIQTGAGMSVWKVLATSHLCSQGLTA